MLHTAGALIRLMFGSTGVVGAASGAAGAVTTWSSAMEATSGRLAISAMTEGRSRAATPLMIHSGVTDVARPAARRPASRAMSPGCVAAARCWSALTSDSSRAARPPPPMARTSTWSRRRTMTGISAPAAAVRSVAVSAESITAVAGAAIAGAPTAPLSNAAMASARSRRLWGRGAFMTHFLPGLPAGWLRRRQQTVPGDALACGRSRRCRALRAETPAQVPGRSRSGRAVRRRRERDGAR